MTSLLFMLSFLIHIILILGLYSLYKELKILKNEHASANEIIDVFEAYLAEIKLENERLENKVSLHSFSQDAKVNPIQKEKKKSTGKKMTKQMTENNFIPNGSGVEDELETTLESKVLQLASQGYSSDTIAEKLNCGKTEAELIVKLHKKKP